MVHQGVVGLPLPSPSSFYYLPGVRFGVGRVEEVAMIVEGRREHVRGGNLLLRRLMAIRSHTSSG